MIDVGKAQAEFEEEGKRILAEQEKEINVKNHSLAFRDRVIANFRMNIERCNKLSGRNDEIRDPTDAEIHEITKYVVNVKKRLSKCPVDPGSYWVKQ